LQALALQARGEEEQALAALKRALLLAEPEGYVRTFVDEGAPLATLLRLGIERGLWSAPHLTAYVNRLLDFGFGISDFGLKVEPSAIRNPVYSRAQSAIIEPLSEREKDVLRLLATSLSTPEIADELFVTPNTVRSHVKSIYSKLDAHNRMQAIQRAEELGLL